MVTEKEAAHENKLTYRHFSKIVKEKGGKQKIIAPIKKPIKLSAPTLGAYPGNLNYPTNSLWVSPKGQTNSGCNSAIRSSFDSMKSGRFKNDQGKGIVLYLPLGKVLRNTHAKDIDSAIEFIQRYLDRVMETNVFFGLKCIGEIDIPSPPSCNEEMVSVLIEKANTIRKERVKASIIFGINKQYFPSLNTQNNDTSLEKRWIGVSIDFTKNVVSPPHALAHATVVRYLFYNRYNGIADAFMKIYDESPGQNVIQTLSLAHYWCYQSPYSSYYGLQPEQKTMSFADDADTILDDFKSGRTINAAFSKHRHGITVKKIDPWGNSYEAGNFVSSSNAWEEMKKFVHKNDYKAAFEFINTWVNG